MIILLDNTLSNPFIFPVVCVCFSVNPSLWPMPSMPLVRPSVPATKTKPRPRPFETCGSLLPACSLTSDKFMVKKSIGCGLDWQEVCPGPRLSLCSCNTLYPPPNSAVNVRMLISNWSVMYSDCSGEMVLWNLHWNERFAMCIRRRPAMFRCVVSSKWMSKAIKREKSLMCADFVCYNTLWCCSLIVKVYFSCPKIKYLWVVSPCPSHAVCISSWSVVIWNSSTIPRQDLYTSTFRSKFPTVCSAWTGLISMQ